MLKEVHYSPCFLKERSNNEIKEEENKRSLVTALKEMMLLGPTAKSRRSN